MPDRKERVSDEERQGALDALGEHFSKGRLDMVEFEERSERAAASVTFQELDDLFNDLPLPHYETGLAVRETADVHAGLSEEQVKQRNKWLSKIEELGWSLAGLWVPFWYVFGQGIFGELASNAWYIAFLPLVLMGAFSIVTDILFFDDDEDDEDDDTYRSRKYSRRERWAKRRRGLPSANDE